MMIMIMGGTLISCVIQSPNDVTPSPQPDAWDVEEVTHVKLKWDKQPSKDAVPESEILSRVNNSDRADDVIKNVYPEDDLRSYNNNSLYLVNVDMVFKVECIRQVENYYYTIHKSDKGGRLYLLYEKDKDTGFLRTTSFWYSKDSVTADDFGKLELDVSTENDVKKIDRYARYLMGTTGLMIPPESGHYTNDGFWVIVSYKLKDPDSPWKEHGPNFTVTNVEVNEPRENSILANLLEVDR